MVSEAIAARVRTIRDGAQEVARLCREAAGLLDRMATEPAETDALVEEATALADKASRIDPAYRLVQALYQSGAFNRFRADRQINLNPALPMDVRHRLRIERDRANVLGLADAADRLCGMLGEVAA